MDKLNVYKDEPKCESTEVFVSSPGVVEAVVETGESVKKLESSR